MGALQGIGMPTPYASPMPWGNPGIGATQSYPFTQPFTTGLPISGTGTFGPYAHQQSVLSLQAAVQQALQSVPQQLQQIQQLVHPVPYQLQQIQQLLQVLAQLSYQQQQFPLQPFQPPLGIPGWQAGQTQPFSGQPGYVM